MTARLDSHCVSEYLQRRRSHLAMISVPQLILGVSLFDHLYQGRSPANRCQLRKKHIKRHFCAGAGITRSEKRAVSLEVLGRVGAKQVAQDKRGRDADRTLRSSGCFLFHGPLIDVGADIAIVELDRVLGRAVVTRVDLEDFPRPLVETVLVLGGNAVADLELEGLCR